MQPRNANFAIASFLTILVVTGGSAAAIGAALPTHVQGALAELEARGFDPAAVQQLRTTLEAQGYESDAIVIATCFAVFGGTGAGIVLCIALAAVVTALCLTLKPYRRLPCWIAA